MCHINSEVKFLWNELSELFKDGVPTSLLCTPELSDEMLLGFTKEGKEIALRLAETSKDAYAGTMPLFQPTDVFLRLISNETQRREKDERT